MQISERDHMRDFSPDHNHAPDDHIPDRKKRPISGSKSLAKHVRIWKADNLVVSC